MSNQSLANSPTHLLRRALQRVTAVWQEEVSELTSPQFATLAVLAESPGMDQSSLTRATAIDRSTMTTLLDRLSQGGWVARETDPDNRRRRIVRITPEGRELVRRLEPAAERVNQWAVDQLGDQKVSVLLPLLRELAGVESPSGPSQSDPNGP